MTKLDQAVQIVSQNPTNKEACIDSIMKANNTYRSNALVYYKKALAKLGSSVNMQSSTMQTEVHA